MSTRASELELHLMRCRRRGERASLLVARVASPRRSTGRRLSGCFRLTDSVAVTRVRHGYELTGLFDDDGLERAALERRLRTSAGVEASVAWARFPDDGLTLGALISAARASLRCGERSPAAALAPMLVTASPSAPADGK
jgi:hypothetical protein